MNKIIPIILMALVTYAIRVVPMVLFRGEIKNPFIKSFLHYIPYCILTAMIIPSIFTSTTFISSAIGGFLVALILSWFERSLITVSIIAVIAAYIIEVYRGFFANIMH
jgi:branched-subunit amino acid transport protein